MIFLLVNIAGTRESRHYQQYFDKHFVLHSIFAPWYIRNDDLHKHLKVKTVMEEAKLYVERYKRQLEDHPNQIAVQLTNCQYSRQLKRRDHLTS